MVLNIMYIVIIVFVITNKNVSTQLKKVLSKIKIKCVTEKTVCIFKVIFSIKDVIYITKKYRYCLIEFFSTQYVLNLLIETIKKYCNTEQYPNYLKLYKNKKRTIIINRV